ncbi:MAG TPA: type II toxin-antitoxin system VapC family toxin [Candidatus Binatia bacterium]|nr:type II toxin-antitoxin system VapC family toxin [Candidatus Binatia bacterium]
MILLDTHVLLWAVDDSKNLSRAAASAIRRARRQGGIAVSAISVWELASLLARGRIRRYGTLESSLKLLLEYVIVIPITPEIAALGAQFPHDYPGDPADRIIGGTARAEGLTLVTHDERIRRSTLIKTVW